MRNWEVIDYPREKLEFIILDDSGLNNRNDMFDHDKSIRFISESAKLTIGQKRNLLCEYAKHELYCSYG